MDRTRGRLEKRADKCDGYWSYVIKSRSDFLDKSVGRRVISNLLERWSPPRYSFLQFVATAIEILCIRYDSQVVAVVRMQLNNECLFDIFLLYVRFRLTIINCSEFRAYDIDYAFITSSI